MPKLADRINCTGCSACASVCGRSALGMKPDKAGFLYPVVDDNLCIQCGRCTAVCPVLKPNEPDLSPKCFAARTFDSELLRCSSSGGVFSELAKQILAEKGSVFGCVADDFYVRQVKIDSEAGLSALRGSKYVQSDVRDSYRIAQSDLQFGRNVLYSGTPCQIAGLKRFLGKEYENLICVEVLCYGVPSPMAFCKLAQSYFGQKGKITDVSFRNKDAGWWGWAWVWDKIFSFYDDGRLTCGNENESNAYVEAFLNLLSSRRSCYQCTAKDGRSGADLSIGDFWGLEKSSVDIKDGLGMSAVMVHTKRGQELFDRADCWRQEVKLDEITKSNRGYFSSKTPPPKSRRAFLFLVRFLSNRRALHVIELIRTRGRSLFRGCKSQDGGNFVGIMTYNWRVMMHNYGTFFQHLALRNALTSLGYRPFRIDNACWRDVIFTMAMPIRATRLWILSLLGLKKRPDAGLFSWWPLKEFFKFYFDYKKHIGVLFDQDDLKKKAFACIAGSDQVWTSGQRECFLGDVEDDVRKLTYAVSADWTAVDNIPGWEDLIKMTAQTFAGVSIRESVGVEKYKKITGREDVVRVCDPVLLMRPEFYVEKFHLKSRKSKQGNMVCYFVNACSEKDVGMATLREIATTMNKRLRFIGIQGAENIPTRVERVHPTPNQFLQLILDADIVFTNSFHGLLFSILFNKQFVFVQQVTHPGIDQNMRQYEYLEFFGLTDRAVGPRDSLSDVESVLAREIDWKRVNERVERFRILSREWLRHKLSKD